MSKLWPFVGGIRLPAHKQGSANSALKAAGLPGQLVYPLMLRNGQNARLLVPLGGRVRKGQVIAAGEGLMDPPIHAASSGWVRRSVEPRLLPHPSGLRGDCIVIDTDGEDEPVECQDVAAPLSLSPAELRGRIHAAGIVGLGGAGFPTAVKTDPGHRSVDTLILNGAECEPYITCDDSLLRHFPDEVLGGAEILLRVLGAARCLLAVEDDMPEALAALQKALSEGAYTGIQVVSVPAVYPSGGEKQLIRALTGREVPASGIPADIGVVCQNVATAAAVRRAVTTGEPLLSRIVTITGQGVRQPQNLIARIGTPIAELVGQCGGYTEKACRLVLGGPMMGFALSSDEVPVVKAANCVFVAGAGEVSMERQAMPCIRCGECAAACPVGLLPQQLYWHARAGDWAQAADYHAADCIECGCCDYVCPSHIPLVNYFRSAKSHLAAQAREREKADHARLRYEARQARKEKERLEKADSARRKKELLEKLKTGQN